MTAKRAGWPLRIVLLAIPLLPYAAVWVQTAVYGAALRPDVKRALLDTGMSDGDIRSLRVLSITPSRAEVYVIEPCTACCVLPKIENSESGETITLQRVRGRWKLSDWDVPWSDCGSADGNIFPPDPEAKEF